MLSDEKGEYYIVILGASKEIEKKFETEIFQNHMKKISGYYINGNPSDKELKDLAVNEKPLFIVFDTESEVYRTNNILDLNDYLLEIE